MSENPIDSAAFTVIEGGAPIVFSDSLMNWKNYEIDFEKVRTLYDVIAVLRGLQITISIEESQNVDRWIPLYQFLKEKT